MSEENYSVGDKVACVARNALHLGKVTGISETIRSGTFAYGGTQHTVCVEVEWEDNTQDPIREIYRMPTKKRSRFSATSRFLRKI